ncbi:MAG: DUF1674 domain-containing protein [Alphaproteobacteria bacterium]|nr:MAG: DUF1674 domain-containing protein [Alphaproteobacteria bacterium]
MYSQRKKPEPQTDNREKTDRKATRPKEIGGRKGPEPTRYGDWENNGITSDF